MLSAPDDPGKADLAVFKLFTSVQLVPFQISVSALTGEPRLPPAANPEVEEPFAPPPFPPLFKSLTSVQLVPFHNSVPPYVPGGAPPTANAAVFVCPSPAKSSRLAVFKLLTSVQLVPL